MNRGGGIGQATIDAARAIEAQRRSDPVVRHAEGGDVGPNAVIQTRAAMIDALGIRRARLIFGDAGLSEWFERPPASMVPAEIVRRLNSELLAGLDRAAFDALMTDAGRRTGRYILDNRIPGSARTLLGLLPAGVAARALLKAIRANAWTFAGNAEVCVAGGHPALIEIAGNPLPLPGCPWHVAVFEVLFSTLLRRTVPVSHTMIATASGHLDRFEIWWRAQGNPRGA